MNHKDVLLDMLENYAFGLHRTIADLPAEALQWQPDPEANNIMVTVWHVCRALDLLKVKIIENRPHQDHFGMPGAGHPKPVTTRPGLVVEDLGIWPAIL